MRVRITHTTRYRYHRSVNFGRHHLVLRPREGHDLAIAEHRLHIEPAHTVTWLRDVHGNVIASVSFTEASSALTIVNDVLVVRVAPFPARQMHVPFRLDWPPRYDPLESAVVTAYLTMQYPGQETALRAWLAAHFSPTADDAEGSALALTRAVHSAIRYRRRMEKGVQSPMDTVELASGSCRDMATLLMEVARASGLAARFASGYLHAASSMAGNASTHAWVEMYLPQLGWRGFDPTMGEMVDARHIVTGVSQHPRGVMPVSGTFEGTAADFADLSVAVRTQEEPASAAGESTDAASVRQQSDPAA